jgi:4-amino-4-deoxy-L-arabinose transferase-like glycosyltransferase
MRSSAEPTAQISWWTLLLAFALISTTLAIGGKTLGLTGPDEPRYAAIAREMARTGDWVTPRLFGHPWFEKPALYYWTAAGAFRLLGVNEFAARLPDVLAALFAIAVTWFAAARAYGLQVAWLTAVMLPTAFGMAILAHGATPDMLFCAALTATAVAALEMFAKPRAGIIARLAFGASLGIAMLAKGPAAIALTAGAAFLWALGTRRWIASFRLINFASILAFGLIGLPWYILTATRNPEFLREFLWEHNIQRYLTPEFHHQQPFWFFVVVILGLLLPWTPLLWPLAVDARRAVSTGTWRDSPAFFLACWAVFPLIFFSFSQSKLPPYVLPSVPLFILLFALSLTRRFQATTKAGDRCAGWVGCTFVGMFLLEAYLLQRGSAIASGLPVRPIAGLLAVGIAGGVLCVSLAIAGKGRVAVLTTAAVVLVLQVGANALVLPKLDSLISARAIARTAPEEAREADRLFDFYLNPEWRYGLEFYLDRELPPLPQSAARPLWIWTTPERTGKELGHIPHCTVVTGNPSAWLLRLDRSH